MNKKIKNVLTLGVAFSAIAGGIALSTKANGLRKLLATECTHTTVEHHDAVAATILSAGNEEYWCCCDCHVSFKDAGLTQVYTGTNAAFADASDERYVARKATSVVDSCLLSANGISTKASSEVAPSVFSTVREATLSGDLHGMFYSAVSIASYEEVAFALKTNGRYIFNGVKSEDPDQWFFFDLTNAGDTKWNLVVTNEANEVVYTENNLASVGANPAAYAEGALNSILYGCPSGFYAVKGSNEELVVTVTEVLGAKASKPITGVVVDSCFYSANGVVTEETSEKVPAGFENIRKTESTADIIHGQFYSAANIESYSEVHFAVKTNGGFDYNWQKTSPADQWLYFSLTNNGNKTWNLVVTLEDDTVDYSMDNMNGTGAGGVYSECALNYILYGCPAGIKAVKGSNDKIVAYATEVRGTAL